MPLRNSSSVFFFFASLLVIFFTAGENLFAQTLKTSTATGNWTQIPWNPAGNPTTANNVNLGHAVTIREGTTVHINNLDISNNGRLIVNGTLVLNGSLSMQNNGSEFVMGPNAIVIIYGNFLAANRVDVSISSFLIIHGDFTKTGSAGQGDLDVSNGNIYIFGAVSGWNNFGNCNGDETYDGETPQKSGDCDYGDEEDYEDNYSDFPDEVSELQNCLRSGRVENREVCENESATFSISPLANVSYQWQIRDPGATWQNVGTNSSTYTIVNTTVAVSGRQVRVVLRPTTDVNCKIAISNAATLTVNAQTAEIGTISGPAEICAGPQTITYSIPEMDEATNYTWTLPNSWIIVSGNNTNTINVQADTMATSGLVQVDVTGICGNRQATLDVKVFIPGHWTGAADTNWNNINNWSCNSLPTLETNVVIPANPESGNYPEISMGVNAFSKDLNIEAGASVTVTGNWLRIAGAIQNLGSLNAVNGSVSFEGTSSQTIVSETFENNNIENLLIDNPSGVTSEGILDITGTLKVAIGLFITGNALTLISSAEKTALIDGSGTGEIQGTVTMQRYLEPAFGYKYFSSPFSNTTVGDFTDIDLTEAFPSVYRYNENRTLNLDEDVLDATGWEAYTNPDAALNILEGYALNFGDAGDARLVELTGLVNNGPFSRILENNNRDYTKGFHLVGNPYPSPIDWNLQDGWDKQNIDDGIYFYTAGDSRYTGTYTSYVNGISSEDGKASSIIPSMQGFFIKVSDPEDGVSKVTGSLGINNNARVLDFNQEFLKTRETGVHPLLRLTAAFEGSQRKDALVIYFSQDAGDTYENKLDAHKLMNTDTAVPSFYSISSDKMNLSINALPLPGTGAYEKVPLGLRAAKSGKMTIHLSQVKNFPRNLNIYLIDTEKRIGQNLRNKSSYTFNIQEGENNSRFQLLFSEDKITDPAIAFNDKFSVDSSGDHLKVRLNLEDGQKGVLRVSSVTGQLLETKEGRGKEEIELRAVTSSGMYFINLYVGDKTYSKKVLKK